MITNIIDYYMCIYWGVVKYFLKLNRIPIKNYTGYSVDPRKDTITIYTTNNRYKIPCRKLDELIEVINL